KEPDRRWQSAAELRDAIADVATEVALSNTASQRSRALVSPPPVRRRRRLLAAALAIAMAATAGVVWWARSSSGGAPAATAADDRGAIPSLAVLPLTNFTGEPEYFVDGMTDALISSLAQIRGMRVISRQSAMHYKGSTKLLPEIARELGVDYIVEGSVAHEGERVRLNAQVIQAHPETTIWSEAFERAEREVLALESSFAQAVADAVHVAIAPADRLEAASTPAIDPDVYEAYLQGRYYGNQFAEEPLRKAQGYFERAVAQDPGFAPAWVGLADTLIMLGAFHSDSRDAVDNAGAAARKALQLDPDLADAHASMSEVAMNRLDWKTAETEIARALELNPNSATARRRHWMLLSCLLRLDESRREAEAAKRLDPLSAKVSADLGIQMLFQGEYESSVRELRSALELDPEYSLAHVYLWMTYHEMGKDPERGQELRYYLADLGTPELLERYDTLLASEGYEKALHRVATDLDRRAVDRPYEAGVVAGLLAAAGEKQAAIRWLGKGVDRRSWEMAWLAVSPDYKPLRGMPEFKAFLRRLGLPEKAT
ncbi:MAG: hypothetical protein R2862_13565, partial [Thermoanaerobaculia bacterium]